MSGTARELIVSAEIRKNKVKIDALLMRVDICDKAIYQATKDMVLRAKEAGEILEQVKELLPHGQFEKYIDNHPDIHFSARTARDYMTVARKYDAYMEECGSEGIVHSMRDILQYGKKDPPKRNNIGSTAELHVAQNTVPKLAISPVDGGPVCIKTGGAHVYDAEACIHCHDPRPEAAHAAAAEGGDADDGREAVLGQDDEGEAPAEPVRAAEEADAVDGQHAGESGRDRRPDRRFGEVERRYGELTRLLDDLNQDFPEPDLDGIQTGLSISYEGFRKWKRRCASGN